MNPKYCENILAKIGTVCKKQNLLEAGDRILVALSGGKDSYVLLESLAERKIRVPFSIELTAIHINFPNIGYKVDFQYMKDFCHERNVNLHLQEFEVDIEEDSKKSICFICSWNRRKTLFKEAQKLNCNKLAFGHHMDDTIQTLLMNMIYQGAMSAIPYRLSMFEGKIDIIRPLLEISDNELKEFAKIKGYKKESKSCPYENTNRRKVAEILDSIAENHGAAKKNIFRSLNNIDNNYLPKYLK